MLEIKRGVNNKAKKTQANPLDPAVIENLDFFVTRANNSFSTS